MVSKWTSLLLVHFNPTHSSSQYIVFKNWKSIPKRLEIEESQCSRVKVVYQNLTADLVLWKDWKLSLRIRGKARMLLLLFLLNMVVEFLAKAVREKNETKEIWKAWNKIVSVCKWYCFICWKFKWFYPQTVSTNKWVNKDANYKINA